MHILFITFILQKDSVPMLYDGDSETQIVRQSKLSKFKSFLRANMSAMFSDRMWITTVLLFFLWLVTSNVL